MRPARRPCSSTTASVMRLYLSKSAATSSCGVSGAQETARSARSERGTVGGEVAVFERRYGADQRLCGPDEIDRRHGFMAAFEPSERPDRIVDEGGRGDREEIG